MLNSLYLCLLIKMLIRHRLEKKFNKRRQKVANLAVRSLEDKSSNFRRNAIKLLTKLITDFFMVLHTYKVEKANVGLHYPPRSISFRLRVF